MSKFLVRQPNNNLAVFDTNVDTFVATGLTEDQALSVGSSIWDRAFAEKELFEAKQDGPPWNNGVFSEDGLSRWRVALRVIVQQHGLEEMKTTVSTMDCFDAHVEKEIEEIETESRRVLSRNPAFR